MFTEAGSPDVAASAAQRLSGQLSSRYRALLISGKFMAVVRGSLTGSGRRRIARAGADGEVETVVGQTLVDQRVLRDPNRAATAPQHTQRNDLADVSRRQSPDPPNNAPPSPNPGHTPSTPTSARPASAHWDQHHHRPQPGCWRRSDRPDHRTVAGRPPTLYHPNHRSGKATYDIAQPRRGADGQSEDASCPP
jgi:hypothetical protein